MLPPSPRPLATMPAPAHAARTRPSHSALGQHDALLAAQADLQEGEFLAAVLDDLQISARIVLDSTSRHVRS